MSDLTTPNPERIVAVTSGGVAEVLSGREFERFVGLSEDMSLATDILFDNGMLDGKRYALLQAAESSGRNPADFARHLVKLSKAMNR